jgi:hypothetical protein
MNTEPFWTTRDVQRFFGVSKSWVSLRAQVGELPSVMFGRCRRFVPEEVRAWALRQRPGHRPSVSSVTREG